MKLWLDKDEKHLINENTVYFILVACYGDKTMGYIKIFLMSIFESNFNYPSSAISFIQQLNIYI